MFGKNITYSHVKFCNKNVVYSFFKRQYLQRVFALMFISSANQRSANLIDWLVIMKHKIIFIYGHVQNGSIRNCKPSTLTYHSFLDVLPKYLHSGHTLQLP